MNVLLIDDHPLILQALQLVIQGLGSGITVVTADSAAAARAELKAHVDFDLVLLDLQLGDADGFEVLSEFRQAYPTLPVVVVSASDRHSDVIKSIDLGAMGFVPKRASNESLFEALNVVIGGGIYIPPMLLGTDVPAVPRTGEVGAVDPLRAVGEPGHARYPVDSLAEIGLTPRQTEVLQLLLKGLPNKMIARELNLSVETIKDHVAAVLRALGVSSRTQAVLAVSQMSTPGGLAAWRNSMI